MVLRLVRDISQYGYNPLLVCQGETPLTNAVREFGISTIIEPFPNALNRYNRELISGLWHTIWQILPALVEWNARLMRRLKQECVSIVWCSNLRAVLTLLPLKLAWRKPLIWNMWLGTEFGYLTPILYTSGLFLADLVVTEYEHQPVDLFPAVARRIFKWKFRFVYTGIDLEEFENFSNEGSAHPRGIFRIGTLCRITPRKGLECLIQAFASLSDRFPQLQLHIFGEPMSEGDVAYQSQLQDLASQSGIRDKVHFNGWSDNPRQALSTLDLYVSSSLAEGLPGAVREAMAMSKPVVATDVGGTSEVIVHGLSGILVPPAQPESLAAAIETLLADPDRAKAIGREARKRVEELFSAQSFVQNYARVFSELVQRTRQNTGNDLEMVNR